MTTKKTPLRRREAESEIKTLHKHLSYANRVIELFLPPETSEVLDIMETVVKRGLEDAFCSDQGFTLEQYAQYLSNLTYDALHNSRIKDEESFQETVRDPEDQL